MTSPSSQPPAPRRRRRRALVALGVAGVLGATGLPQPAGALPATTPSETWVTNGRVWATRQVGERIYLGGAFTQVGPNVGNGTAIDAASGDRVASPKVNGTVFVAVPDGAGGFYVGGSFTRVGEIGRNNAARILATGEVAAWNPNTNGPVRSIALSADRKRVFLGGDFTVVRGFPRNRLAKVDTFAAAVDAAFAPSADNSVTSLAPSADGTHLYAGGAFATVSGAARASLAALDAATGAVDPGFAPAADGAVHALELRGTRLYAGGAFTALGGAARSRLAALDAATGAVDPAFAPAADAAVRALEVSPDGARLYAGGDFTGVGGAARSRLAALDAATGAVDPAFAPNPNAAVHALDADDATGRLFVAGAFGALGATPRNSLAAVAPATGAVDAWNPNANAPALAVAVATGPAYAGGDFTSVNGVARANLAALDATTGAVDPAWNPGANAEVRALVPSADGTTLFVGGRFSRLGGVARAKLGAVGAATGAVGALNAGGIVGAGVYALHPVGDRLYVGGSFSSVGAAPVRNLAAVAAATGAVDPGFAPNPNATVLSLDAGPSGLFAGGDFTTIGGAVRKRLAQVSPTGAATPFVTSGSFPVLSMDLSPDATRLYVAGGGSSTVGNRVVAYDAATGAQLWLRTSDGDFQAVVASDTTVYAGGHFQVLYGPQVVRQRLAAFDAATGALSDWAPRPNSVLGVWSLALGRDGLLVGGDFTVVTGKVQQGFALLPGAV